MDGGAFEAHVLEADRRTPHCAGRRMPQSAGGRMPQSPGGRMPHHDCARPPASLIDRIDLRTRIIAAAVFAITVVALDDLAALVLGLGVSFGLLVMAQLPIRGTLRRMIAMDGFIVFALLLLPFTVPVTVPGEPMFELFGLTASWAGLRQAIGIALKANAIILALMSLVGSTDPVTLGHALRRLWVSERLVHLLLFTVRYIEVLQQEFQRLQSAMRARGFRLRNSRHTYRSIGYLLGMMLVRAVDRSERILEAMKCRGFTGRFPLLDQFAFSAIDLVFALGFGVAVSALVVVQTLG